nr:hypothetical protein B0A51_18316 [Rachicladosporium sp. CCFEE 5018]
MRTEFLQHKRHSLLSTSRTLRIYVPRFDFSQAIKAINYLWAREPDGAPIYGMTVVLIVDGPDLDTRSLGRWIQHPAASSLNIQYLLRLNVMSKEHHKLTHTVLRGMKSSVPAPPEWQGLRNALASSQGHYTVISPLMVICKFIRAEYQDHTKKRPTSLRRSQRALIRVQNFDFTPALALLPVLFPSGRQRGSKIVITLCYDSVDLDIPSYRRWLKYVAMQKLKILYWPKWSAVQIQQHHALHDVLDPIYRSASVGEDSLRRAILGCERPPPGDP